MSMKIPLKVMKRDGTVVEFDQSKIVRAVAAAFLAVDGSHYASTGRVHDLSEAIASDVTKTMTDRYWEGAPVNIEEIQDQVERHLMRRELTAEARAYILYRNERAKERAASALPSQEPVYTYVKTPDDDRVYMVDLSELRSEVAVACRGLSDTDPDLIIREAQKSFFPSMPAGDIRKALVMAARTAIEAEPDYTYVAARLLLQDMRTEALSCLTGQQARYSFDDMKDLYALHFRQYLELGVQAGRISAELLEKFSIDELAGHINWTRDEQFNFLGIQTVYDRYLLHVNGVRFELPQWFFMRVAMGLAINESCPTERAMEFYDTLSSFDAMSSTPTLFNSGTVYPQLSSCFLTTVPDDLAGIYSAIHDNAMLSKFSGGLGNDWTPVRALGSMIKGTNGKSQGTVPFLKVVNSSAVAVNQGGKRKGAVCAYLETWHLDIEEFLELRKNTGDERRRTHDMNTANWIPDLFMQRVERDEDWTLFSPDEVGDLHDLYGRAFKKRYEEYERQAMTGQIRSKRLKAKDLWRKMLSMLFETGHPWMTFKDPCNIRSPQQHAGVVHSSNLCTEITLNTSETEIAVCNLASININNHVDDAGNIDRGRLHKTVRTAVRMLDNVVDINYHTVEKARISNLLHRPVGLGVMGEQDALHRAGIPRSSQSAVDFVSEFMEMVSFYAISASTELAVERGVYPSYNGSLWSKGIFPMDTVAMVMEEREDYEHHVTPNVRMDWSGLREKVAKQGMRNSNLMAIAPTATISNIIGVSQSIEPTYQNLFVKSNMSGEFTVINPYLVRDLKKLGIWDRVMINDLKFYEGSLRKIDRIPGKLKELYATAFEIDPVWLIEAAAHRQVWIDQAQSLNLYIAGANGRKLDEAYRYAWKRGLKTTYYLRATSATSTEKSTVDNRSLNAVSAVDTRPTEPVPAPVPLACSIDNPDCEACQ